MASVFTPISGLLGGTLIGSAASALLWYNGDVMGASGILNVDKPARWKQFFVGAFCLTAHLLASSLGAPVLGHFRAVEMVGAGWLVGLGTRIGNGCTSGHGVCGLGRFSRRSIAAVLTFLTTGVLTASFVAPDSRPSSEGSAMSPVLGAAVTALALGWPLIQKLQPDQKAPAAVGSASLFSAGLYIAGMVHTPKVLGFLNVFESPYDPTLLTVLGAAVILSFLSYRSKGDKPVCVDGYCVPNNTTIDAHLIAGAVLFGLGWGYVGLCPGPALFAAAAGSVPVTTLWFPGFFAGSYLGTQIQKRR